MSKSLPDPNRVPRGDSPEPVTALHGGVPPAPKKKLLEEVRDILRLRHYSLRTEEAYLQWIRRFIIDHGKRHPNEMGADEVHTFLTHLAVEGEVAASTQLSGTNRTE